MARKTAAQRKVSSVLRRYKAGKLRTGTPGVAGKGPKVASRKQAVAIALSEAGVTRRGGTSSKPRGRGGRR